MHCDTAYTNFIIFIKGGLKIACSFNNNVSASGGLRPSDPLSGRCLRTRLKDLHLPKPPFLHNLCAVEFSSYLWPYMRTETRNRTWLVAQSIS